MDWAGVGRNGEAGALNAQLAGAFRVGAELARAVGWARAAARLDARAAAIGRALNERHWDARRRVYVDMVDPVSGAQEAWTSQHATAAIALWADAPEGRVRESLARIAESQRLTFTAAPPIAPTGATLEPEDGVVLANTFYSHFVYEALARHGGFANALRLMRERYGPMLARGATTLWESFEPTASLCHGFSATPTYQLSRRVLGVAPAAPGFAEIELAPDLADLDHAEGVVPTPHGDVEARLERTRDGFVARYRTPTGVGARAAPPPGLAIADWPALTGTQIEIRFERTAAAA
jgi:hypothetical protein